MKKSRLNFIRLITMVCLSFYFSAIVGATPTMEMAPQQSLFDSWEGEDILKVTIKGDLASVINNKKSADYQPIEISWKTSNGTKVETVAKIRVRGKYRRRVCGFPPLKIKFKKDRLAHLGYTPDFNSLKLVTHCLDDDKVAANENVLQEYLIYKMYEEVTDNSFRTQLVEVTYIDESGEYGNITRYGFFIEKKSELAQRMGGKSVQQFNTDRNLVMEQDEVNMALFQYMIGNEDWSVSMHKNNALIQVNANFVPVPYDFDFSGVVAAKYARLVPQHGLSHITDRIYLGYPVDNKVLLKTINAFRAKQSNFANIINNQEGLSKRSKRELISYINSFFDIVDYMEESEAKDYFFFLKEINNPNDKVDDNRASSALGER